MAWEVELVTSPPHDSIRLLPCWDGGGLEGRTILLHDAESPNHTLRLLRYARLAKERGGQVVFACRASLVPVVSLCPHIDIAVSFETLEHNIPGPRCDCHAPLATLPRLFGTGIGTVSAALPYLQLPADLRQTRNERFVKTTPMCVGLGREVVEAVKFVEHPGTDLPNTEIVSISQGENVPLLVDLDLLITQNSVLAHLAGALGTCVWYVLPEETEIDWIQDSGGTPWYPNMRVFQPEHSGLQQPVWESVAEELHAVASGQRYRLRTRHCYVKPAPRPQRSHQASPLVSVIMPIWNAARYLHRALASVRCQTFTDWELLAIDDGSTDESWGILQQAAANDSRIVPLRLAGNHGPATARNVGLRKARGEWIAYLDSDDTFVPHHLARLAGQHIHCDVLVFAYDVYQENADRSPSVFLHLGIRS